MAYHSKGIGKNKKIMAERKKPLPLHLMRSENAKVERVGVGQRRVEQNITDVQNFQSAKGSADGQGLEG